MRRALCVAGALFALATATKASLPSEYELKAAYVFSVLRFVERQTIGTAGPYVTLGVHAAGPIEQALQSLEGTPLRGRKLHMRPVNAESELQGCDAVFLGRSNGKSAKILAAAGYLGMLTIGNDEVFLPAGGMIALVVESRRVVVEINADAIAAAGWTVSSHLLEVARIVKGGA